VYVTAETVLRHGRGRQARTCVLADLLPTETPIVLHGGDDLWLTREPLPGTPARPDEDAPGGIAPARISCTLPEVLADVRRGDAIWFDDGRIGGVVEAVEAEGLRVRIHSANGGGERLRADKGINLPDSDITLPALTERDRRDLEFITRHADLVALSFVRTPDDLAEVQRALARPGIRNLGIILKIETRRAFENLPGLLLASLRTRPVGVMIARGDLAVECGFERLAEVQEEILWLCEAAHVPAIWATQVLESMARTGRPSRAEITDAAMSERAECVLLNKGPHIASAIRALDDILRRMQDHQEKKRARLRPLTVSGNLAWRTRAPEARMTHLHGGTASDQARS
jgi:pyruvate kinase